MRSSSQSLKEYGRGIIGGLIFSLPIIYTMEMWWAGFTLPPEKLLLNVVLTYLLLLGYNNFCGIHDNQTFWDVCRESVEEIGIAFLATFLFLWLIGRLDMSMSISEMAGKTIVETMIFAIGISVGTEQLGTGGGNDQNGSEAVNPGKSHQDREFIRMVVLSICGSVLFIAPVAATEEILIIGIESSNVQLLIMVLLSVLLAVVTIFFSDFRGSVDSERDFLKIVSHTVTVYLISLLVAFVFLWFYGNTNGFSGQIIISQVIVLGIPGILGASAGRLLLRSIN